MPTPKPIIRAVVSQSTAAALRRLAAASNQSVSAIVREVLTEAEPVFRQTAGILEVARAQGGSYAATVSSGMSQAVQRLSGDAAQVVREYMAAMHDVTAGAVSGAPAGRSTHRGAVGASGRRRSSKPPM
jgi:Ribbon-helix-helix protein, copG family